MAHLASACTEYACHRCSSRERPGGGARGTGQTCQVGPSPAKENGQVCGVAAAALAGPTTRLDDADADRQHTPAWRCSCSRLPPVVCRAGVLARRAASGRARSSSAAAAHSPRCRAAPVPRVNQSGAIATAATRQQGARRRPQALALSVKPSACRRRMSWRLTSRSQPSCARVPFSQGRCTRPAAHTCAATRGQCAPVPPRPGRSSCSATLSAASSGARSGAATASRAARTAAPAPPPSPPRRRRPATTFFTRRASCSAERCGNSQVDMAV